MSIDWQELPNCRQTCKQDVKQKFRRKHALLARSMKTNLDVKTRRHEKTF